MTSRMIKHYSCLSPIWQQIRQRDCRQFLIRNTQQRAKPKQSIHNEIHWKDLYASHFGISDFQVYLPLPHPCWFYPFEFSLDIWIVIYFHYIHFSFSSQFIPRLHGNRSWFYPCWFYTCDTMGCWVQSNAQSIVHETHTHTHILLYSSCSSTVPLLVSPLRVLQCMAEIWTFSIF